MKTILSIMLFAMIVALPVQASVGTLPRLAAELSDELDAQLSVRLATYERPAGDYTLIMTTPVDLNDLTMASPLSRLLSEEMATWFVSMGYRVQEIRKGNNILFDPQNGELLLSRNVNLVDERNAQSVMVMAGTYTVTSQHVRFNIKIISAATSEVFAMASGTLDMTPEAYELLQSESTYMRFSGIQPSVMTNLQ